MSKYLLNKFLYTVDRDPELVERYREDPRGTVEWWEAERANVILNVLTSEQTTWLKFDDVEREALATFDIVKLFELGAHPFLFADPLHRDVRARLPRTARLPARVRPAAVALHAAVSGHQHLTPDLSIVLAPVHSGRGR